MNNNNTHYKNLYKEDFYLDINNIYIYNNDYLNTILKQDIIYYLNEPIIVKKHNYNLDNLLIYSNKHKIKTEKSKLLDCSINRNIKICYEDTNEILLNYYNSLNTEHTEYTENNNIININNIYKCIYIILIFNIFTIILILIIYICIYLI